MKKNLTLILVAVSAVLTVGCGSDSGNTTKAEEETFKSGEKPTVTIPEGANKPPANFKSSLDNGSGPKPGGAAPTTGG